MIVFPKAKINIGLRITGKRYDGYHDIETVFYPVGLCDAMEFVISPESDDKDSLTVTGIFPGNNDDNLVIKTAKKLREKYFFPYLKIHLHKAIPTGSGLGGGSSDAACLLKAVIKFFNLPVSEPEILDLALELGSDCPFFINKTPSFATGRGEILEPVSIILSGYYLVLLNPGVGINTREAYQNCHPGMPVKSLKELIDHPFTEWRNHITNDFEDYAFSKYPEISEIKNELYKAGAIFSLMSGSGSSVYGIFPEKPSIKESINGFIIWEGLM